MRLAIVIFVSFFLGCGGEGGESVVPPIEKLTKECKRISVDKGPLTILIWLSPEQKLENKFVLQSLNTYWNAVGVKVVLADSPETAHIGLIYVHGGCKWPIETGRIQLEYWANLDSIIVDYGCFEKMSDFNRKFPAAVSHALGNLIGIEAVPAYCGAGIMKKSILTMTEEPPAALSREDITAYWNRDDFSSKPMYEEVCSEAIPEAGQFQPTDFRTIRFFADSAFRNTPIEDYLNGYFPLFGRSFQLTADEAVAEFKMKPWTLTKTGGCSPLAVARSDKREIQVRVECLSNAKNFWAESIITHEVAHFVGMNHVPNWCAPAIMNPYVTALPYFVSDDVLEWRNRDLSDSILDSQRILRVKHQERSVILVPLGHLRLERKF